jgi:hypothetical protein
MVKELRRMLTRARGKLDSQPVIIVEARSNPSSDPPGHPSRLKYVAILLTSTAALAKLLYEILH